MIVLDILLFCNLLLFAVCACRAPRAKGTRIDDLVGQATGWRSTAAVTPVRAAQAASGATPDNVIEFPGPAEMARRRARVAHPATGLRHHPGIG